MRRTGLVFVLTCTLILSLLSTTVALWAAPRADPLRQTVPTMTATSPPSPPTPTSDGGVEDTPVPPQPTATSTWTPQPSVTLAATLEPSPMRSPTSVVSPSGSTASPASVLAWDFGDAPDLTFPSLLASDGARHATVRLEWLGEGVDQEGDSRQVDYDLYDDGIKVGDLTICTRANLDVIVSVDNRTDPQHPYDTDHLLYLNVLVDWDGDGSWAGRASCPEGSVATEWALQNLAIDVSSWPEGSISSVVSLQFPVGREAGNVWARFTLSYGEMVSGDDWDGRGAFTFGETEDHLLSVLPSPSVTPQVASPAPAATLMVTPTVAAVAAPPTGANRWQLLLCSMGGVLLGIALAAVWGAKRISDGGGSKRWLLMGILVMLAVILGGLLLYYGSQYAPRVLGALRGLPTGLATPCEESNLVLTATEEPRPGTPPVVPPTPYERLIPTPTASPEQTTEPFIYTPELTMSPPPAGSEVAALLPSLMPVRERFGFGVPIPPVEQFQAEQLGAGWYYNWRTDPNPARPQGIEFVQMVQVRGTSFSPMGQDLEKVVQNNPGSLWLVGNEPDVIWQNNTTPGDYARVYHEVYNLLKSRDPTCQVAIGGVSQVTPLRLQYLDMILQAYQDDYGEMIPVDVWNVHGFILREERGSWGVDLPPGISVDQGRLYEIEDHDDVDVLREQVVAFRRWMREKGERDKPLIVSEYGIVMPADYGFPYEKVRDFMYSSFNYFLTASDAALGHPADGNRLVQRWAWYSLSDRVYPTANLFDPDTGQITLLGLAYASFTSSL